MSPLIQINKVSKSYLNIIDIKKVLSFGKNDLPSNRKLAVNNVTLQFEIGERIGIIGKNGAGKSTLLHMIAGLANPTEGDILVEGKVTSILTMGLGIREELSGRENIYIDGALQGKTKKEIDSVINEIIGFADIGDFIDLPVKTYSTGMKARLAFSMIANIEPEILIIDEALSAGDANFSRKASAKIKDICNRGKIVIIVAHSMQSIKDICNRCIWMDSGRVVMDGTPENVTKAYTDSVREEDDQLLQERFKQSVVHETSRSGCDLPSLYISDSDVVGGKSILFSGGRAQINVSAITTEINSSCVQLRIVRMDELVFFDEVFSFKAHLSIDNLFNLIIDMDPLLLNAGIYKLESNLLLGSKVIAKRSLIFEVQNNNPVTGGKPSIVYDPIVSVIPC